MTSASGAKPGRGDEPDDDERALTRGSDDEPSMHALRSVWLTMRDEEPPSSGLADLLAAARVKAAEMRPAPTWWERLGAAMRRPPALALASVALLVGGGVIVGRQLMEAPERLEQRSMAVRAPTLAGSAAVPAGSAAADEDDELRPKPMAAPMGEREPTMDSKRLDGRSKSERSPGYAKGAKPRTPVSPVSPVGTVAPLGARSTGPTAGDVAKNSTGPSTGVAKLDEVTAPGSSGTRDPASAATVTTKDKPGSAPATRAAAAAGAVTTKSSPGSAPTSLYRECELAAVRGDCDAVRALVSRIARADRGYRGRLAKDSPIARCLSTE